ncbi:MAG: hypothetical protein ACI97N_002610 [Cognaticolwellia sp.]|jgi:hypothetical protein
MITNPINLIIMSKVLVKNRKQILNNFLLKKVLKRCPSVITYAELKCYKTYYIHIQITSIYLKFGSLFAIRWQYSQNIHIKINKFH